MQELSDHEQETVIANLLTEMQRLGCANQKEFAAIIGISPSYLNLILSGKRLGIRKLRSIAKKLRRTLEYFLTPQLADTSATYAVGTPAPLDEALLTAVLEKINQCLKGKQKLTAGQQARLVARLYSHYQETGDPVSDLEIAKYLLLID